MNKIVIKKVPNAIGSSDVTDPVVRQKVMLLQENIQSLSSQLEDVQKALVDLRGVSKNSDVEVSRLAVRVAPLVADVVYEKTDEASGYADSASTSATNAAESATNAAESASTAEQRVTSALNGVLSVVQYVFDKTTISTFAVMNKTITKAGFVPVAIASLNFNTRYAYASRWYIVEENGQYIARLRVSNIGSGDQIEAEPKITVLYAKDVIVQ